MRNGKFVMDAHTGFWDASPENCKNKYGEAFIETFYAFHTGFNPTGEPQWHMDYETVFRKVDPDWYLENVFVQAGNDMAILSTQVLMTSTTAASPKPSAMRSSSSALPTG